ncbi:hypothetical protein [Pinisolibacter sp.]|uniref:hypothetical protein n=1 Tax=Pinisolibacter sp. TaxID=2172024 RepID=UPI002FDE293B
MTPKMKMMTLAAATAVVMAFSTGAANAWACHAKSRLGEGWGYSPDRRTAQQEAKLKCQLTTPRRMSCRIVSCRNVGPRFLGR